MLNAQLRVLYVCVYVCVRDVSATRSWPGVRVCVSASVYVSAGLKFLDGHRTSAETLGWQNIKNFHVVFHPWASNLYQCMQCIPAIYNIS